MNQFIPVNTPSIGSIEKKYLLSCIESGWISSEGPYINEFEVKFSNHVNRRYGIAVANGTAALEIAIAAIDLKPGDEVIMPSFTIISCPQAVVRAGGVPVLIDSDLTNWNLDVNKIEEKITQKTKAIMVVHIYGLPVNIGPILELSSKYGLYLIEDAAQMIGQTWNDKPCGSFGHLSTFSFYPNKHITTGEGGMIVTDNENLSERCREYRNLCFKPGRRFVHEDLGWNYRMTNMQAALGLAQLQRLDEFIIKKRQMGALYNTLLKGIDGLILPPQNATYADSIYWVYGLMVDDSQVFDASDIINTLELNGIGSRPFFWPIHEQPIFKKMGLFVSESYPIAEKMARRGFYLPSGLGLTIGDQHRVVEGLFTAMHHLRSV